MRRREFITLIGGTVAAWPLAARAQQPAMPVIGFLNSTSPDGFTERLRKFSQGLKENGFVEGENVAIEYRWAENQIDRLPALATDLVRRRVAVIAATGGPAVAFAARAATATIPVVFLVNDDPVKLGLVTSLARPGGNLTGINTITGELAAKRLELLHELVPAAKRVAVIINPENTVIADTTVTEVNSAAPPLGLQIQTLKAASGSEIDAAFATFTREQPDALFVSADAYFNTRRIQIVQHAAHRSIPATYASREIAEVGGLMSYGTNIRDAYRQVGAYTGRILKGAKPADLTVEQASKFELVINHQTAKMLGIVLPPSLHATADEVIE
jgi:putative ABC transport system substrate-binding protein